MSRFTTTMYANAASSTKGFITGDPDAPLRQSWAEVHERARSIAGALAAAGQQQVWALELATGKVLWKSTVARAYRNGMGNGARATPTIAGDTVVVFTGEGVLVVLEAVYSVTDPPIKALRRVVPPLRLVTPTDGPGTDPTGTDVPGSDIASA